MRKMTKEEVEAFTQKYRDQKICMLCKNFADNENAMCEACVGLMTVLDEVNKQ